MATNAHFSSWHNDKGFSASNGPPVQYPMQHHLAHSDNLSFSQLPSHHSQAPQIRGPTRYKIVKPSFHSYYECRPMEHPDGPAVYQVKISDSSRKPNLTMMGRDGLIAAAYLPKPTRDYDSRSTVFRIDMQQAPMGIEMMYHGKDKYGWSFSLALPHLRQPIPLRWVKDNSVAVDGMRASSISNTNCKLEDPNGQVMAVFTSDTWGFSLSYLGGLQINVDLGPMFEHAVVITLLSLFQQHKRESDEQSSNNARIGGAAAVAAS